MRDTISRIGQIKQTILSFLSMTLVLNLYGYDKRLEDSLALSKPQETRYGWRAFGPDVKDSGKGRQGEFWVSAHWHLGSYGIGNAFLGPLDFIHYPTLTFEVKSSLGTPKQLWIDLNQLLVIEGVGFGNMENASINAEGKQAQVLCLASSRKRKPIQVSKEWQRIVLRIPEDIDLFPGVSTNDLAQVDELTVVVENPGKEIQETLFIRNVRLAQE